MPSANTKSTNKKEMVALIKRTPGITNYFELINSVGVSKNWFYRKKFNEDEKITEAIRENQVRIKMSLKNKWFNSGNFSAEVCLFKLLADDDELKRLQIIKDNSDDGSQSKIVEFLESMMNKKKTQDDEFDIKQAEYEEKHQ